MITSAKQVAHGVIEVMTSKAVNIEAPVATVAQSAPVSHPVSNDNPPPPVVQNATGDIPAATEDEAKK